MRTLLGSAFLLALLFAPACRCANSSARVEVDAGPAHPAAANNPAEMGPPEEQVKPVYDLPGGKPDPLAVRYCNALHAFPEQRKAACCSSRPVPTLADHCANMVTAALHASGLTLDESSLAACEVAMQKAYEGCEWVGPFPPTLPKACEMVLQGKLPAGQRCRSSLECQGTLHCLGAGPTDKGICGVGRAEGGSCNTAVDALGSLLRLDVEALHPECPGYCDHHRCFAAKKKGEACTSPAQCGRELHCSKDVCQEGASAGLGEPCKGSSCEHDLRCIGGACSKPKQSGAACTTPFECAGACLNMVDGGTGTGVCGMKCNLFEWKPATNNIFPPRKPATSPEPAKP